MTYVNSGDLEQLIQQHKTSAQFFSEHEILTYFTQVCLALRHIHQKYIIHRDLKAENIFINMQNSVTDCLLGDFGVGRIMQHTLDLASTQAGTPNIMSPEMYDNEKYTT